MHIITLKIKPPSPKPEFTGLRGSELGRASRSRDGASADLHFGVRDGRSGRKAPVWSAPVFSLYTNPKFRMWRK